MHIQDRIGSYRCIESTKTDWNCTRHNIITCFEQTSDSFARLTQTLARMPDVKDTIERNIKLCFLKCLGSGNLVYPKFFSRDLAAKLAENQESSVHSELRRQQKAQRQSILRAAEPPLQARVLSGTQVELQVARRAIETPEQSQARKFITQKCRARVVEISYVKFYFMGDEQNEVNRRCQYIEGVKRKTVLKIQQMLHSHNVLLKIFKSAIDNWPSNNYKVVIHGDRISRGEHEQRYNAPMVNEVAVLVTDEPCSPRDIVLRAHDNTLQRIADTHKFYDALQYPLIFIRGKPGYHFNIPVIKGSYTF
ncbi:uncharacterized protein TNCV_394861 [Trichonephila clavipes]|nr:uncharacterized protein TNCV_394861 [Trichonephila clavipes]